MKGGKSRKKSSETKSKHPSVDARLLRKKQKQTRLSFQKSSSPSRPAVNPEVPTTLPMNDTNLPLSAPPFSVVVSSPTNFKIENHYNASTVPSAKRKAVPQGTIATSSDELIPISPPAPQSPKSQPQITTDSSPPLSPVQARRVRKLQSQSRIDELFLPSAGSKPLNRTPRRVESDSDSDALDDIQLEDPKSVRPDEDSDDASDIVGPRIRRQRLLLPSSPARPTKSTKPPDPLSDEDLSEEVKDITSSTRKTSLSNRIRDPGTRNKRKSRFQKELKSLKKKKQGVQEETEQEEEGTRGLRDSTSEVESVGSEDFVVEDDHEMSLEELTEIPAEFTSMSYQGPKHNFKVVVQAEVYAELHPDYHNLDYSTLLRFLTLILGREDDVDPYFRQAFQSLERQISGISNSALSSNAWKPWFVKALKERPEFCTSFTEEGFECDACHISKGY